MTQTETRKRAKAALLKMLAAAEEYLKAERLLRNEGDQARPQEPREPAGGGSR